MSIMNEFENQVRDKVTDALKSMGADVQFVTELPSVDTADLAVPCFTMSKALRKAPQAIADDLAAGAEPDASGIPHPMPIHRGEATEKRIVCILLSPAEHEVVVRWAIHEGMTMAELARMAIAVMIEKEDVRDRIEEPEWSLDRKCRSLLEEIGAPQGDAYTTRQVSGKHLRR